MVRWGKRARRWASGLLILAVAAVSVVSNADFREPPRYDGAGYAMLGWSLATGRGYREIATPRAERHTHFPPGYPLVLAGLWRVSGRSDLAAHGLSVGLTLAAVLASWRWFAAQEGEPVALAAGLALAVNWSWGRVGGAIQSEPLYFLLGSLVLLGASRARPGTRPGRGAILGGLLGACLVTRHVAAALAVAVGACLVIRRNLSGLMVVCLVAGAMVLPWAVWLASTQRSTQLDLFAGEALAGRVARQAVFYVQRIPDQLVGPVVEVGTGPGRPARVAAVVNLGAAVVTGIVGWGWWRAIRSPRRRLAGLVPLSTIPLLLVWPFTEAGRFLIPLVPCLIVGAIEGLAAILAGLRWSRRRARVVAAWAVVGLSVPYSAYAIVSGRAEARRQADAPFDAACRWLAQPAARPGPVLSNHPAEVYWMTGRVGEAPAGDDPGAVGRAIDRLGAAYLIVDDQRYDGAPVSPLGAFVRDHPGRVRLVWRRDAGKTVVSIHEVRPDGGASD